MGLINVEFKMIKHLVIVVGPGYKIDQAMERANRSMSDNNIPVDQIINIQLLWNASQYTLIVFYKEDE